MRGPRGDFHLVWVWRDTPDANTNHDLGYARTSDFKQWVDGAGQPVALPITLTGSDVVDPVPPGGGMINNNTKIGFDREGRPVVAYHKFDSAGRTQIYNARYEEGGWAIHQSSNFDYRWDFGGRGSLVFEILLEGVVAQPDGTLTQRHYHREYGGWRAFRLDPDTLAPIEQVDPVLMELDVPRSATPQMVTRWRADLGTSPEPGIRYMLRWETLPNNRDAPRESEPPPTALRLYGFATGE